MSHRPSRIQLSVRPGISSALRGGAALLLLICPTLARGEIELPAAPGEPVSVVAVVNGQPRVLGTASVPGASGPAISSFNVTLPGALEPLLSRTSLVLATRNEVVELAGPDELMVLTRDLAAPHSSSLELALGLRVLPGDYGGAGARLSGGRAPDGVDLDPSGPPRASVGYRRVIEWSGTGASARLAGSGAACGGGFVPIGDRAGGVGSRVVLAGSLCSLASSYDVEDVVMLGLGGIFGRATALTDSFVAAEVEHVGAFAEPTRLRFLFGEGEQHAIPPLGGVSYPEGAWGFRRQAGERRLRTDYLFEPDVAGLFADEETDGFQGMGVPLCGDPKTFVDLTLRIDPDGCLRVRLPGDGTCAGDRVSFRLAFSTPAFANVVVILPSTTGLSDWSWAVASPVILFPLNIVLGASNCVATYDASTREIVICSNDGPIAAFVPGSYVRITFDPTIHSVFTEIQGVIDGYDLSNGAEPSTPDPLFVDCSAAPPRHYDSFTTNSCLRETFDNFGSSTTDGPPRSAGLEMHMKGVGAKTDTDAIRFGWVGENVNVPGEGIFDWTTRHTDLPVLGYQWVPGQEATLCFDLSELPDRYGSPIPHNVVDRLSEDVFHVSTLDDSDIDYMVLKVLRCTH